MKKFLFLIFCLFSKLIISATNPIPEFCTLEDYVEIGPLEQQDDAKEICEKACNQEKDKEWTGRWCCNYSPEINQHSCFCECKK